MAFAHSPKTSTEDLVLIYDTGNRKSYKGEPTDNLTTLSGIDMSAISGYTAMAHTRVTDSESPSGYACEMEVLSLPVNNSARARFGAATNIPTSGTIFVSVYVKLEGTSVTSNITPKVYAGSSWTTIYPLDSGPTQFLTNKYRRFGGSVPVGTNSGGPNPGFSMTYINSNPSVGQKTRWHSPQVEVNTHATPFTSDERLGTDMLSDLAGNVTLDATNTSYAALGSFNYPMGFDGTSDHITGTLPISGGGEPHTIEMVLRPYINQNGFGGRRDPFSIGNTTVHQYSALDINPYNMNWYFYGKDTTFTNSPLLTSGNYYHFVLSYAGGFSNNTNKRVWINGVEQTLSSGVNETPLLPDNPQFSVGRDRGRNTAYFPGEIPVFKVYKKGLTEKEALDNFNAIRKRFNI